MASETVDWLGGMCRSSSNLASELSKSSSQPVLDPNGPDRISNRLRMHIALACAYDRADSDALHASEEGTGGEPSVIPAVVFGGIEPAW